MKRMPLFSLFALFLLFLLFGLYLVVNSEKYQITGTIISHVPTEKNVVALTFDDGPNENTDTLLSILKDKDVVATFYVIGEMVQQYPEETKRIVSFGHELGNHSYTHTRMVLKSPQFIGEEIAKTNELIREAGYGGEITFRPPYGKKFLFLPLYLRNTDTKTITWDVEPTKALGAKASSDQITKYTIEHTQPGSIILFHPWYGQQNSSRDAISATIDQLKAQGYQFVTIRQLLQER